MSQNNIVYENQIPSSVHREVYNEVNCLNVKVVYQYVLSRKPDRVHELFKDLPGLYSTIDNPVEVLTDENNWVSNELVVKIFENAKKILNDPNAPYTIGMESIARRQFGYIQKFFLSAFGGPSVLLKRVNHINSQFNTNKIVENVYSSPNHAVIRLHWKENRGLTSDICSFNRGIYSALPTIWNLPPAEITEPYCYFKGDPYCQFNIHFHDNRHKIWNIFSTFQTRKSQLLSALEQIENDKLVLKKKYDEVNQLNEQLADKVEKLRAINVASNLLVSQDNSEEILKATMKSMIDVLKFDRAIIMLIDKTEQHLEFKYAIGEDPLVIEKYLKNYTIPLRKERNLIAKVARQGRPVYIDDPRNAGLRTGNRIIHNFGVSSFIVAPLLAGDKIIGIVGADRQKSRQNVTPRDLDELAIFTNNIAETLHKAQLKEEVESSYLNTVKALVQAIEEKDAYTRGHSERVAELSVQIGSNMGLQGKQLEYLRLGCLLHDVGKIGISEAIVRKPKDLTEAEYNIIKQHPIKGEEIVRPISFLRDHLNIIRNHHEWYNGAGYPDGLKGEEIPLEAQIVSVADAFDAITSTRPYRQGLQHSEAYQRISLLSGTQFSPRVVQAFSDVYKHMHAEELN
ncbi:MAG: HD-GYP domain-containing protein [Sediminispirochaetaceae bacterium]